MLSTFHWKQYIFVSRSCYISYGTVSRTSNKNRRLECKYVFTFSCSQLHFGPPTAGWMSQKSSVGNLSFSIDFFYRVTRFYDWEMLFCTKLLMKIMVFFSRRMSVIVLTILFVCTSSFLLLTSTQSWRVKSSKISSRTCKTIVWHSPVLLPCERTYGRK